MTASEMARLKGLITDIQAYFPTFAQTAPMTRRFEEVEKILMGVSVKEFPSIDDCINTVIIALARPDAGEHDPFLSAKTSFAVTAVKALVEAGYIKVK